MLNDVINFLAFYSGPPKTTLDNTITCHPKKAPPKVQLKVESYPHCFPSRENLEEKFPFSLFQSRRPHKNISFLRMYTQLSEGFELLKAIRFRVRFSDRTTCSTEATASSSSIHWGVVTTGWRWLGWKWCKKRYLFYICLKMKLKTLLQKKQYKKSQQK